MLREINDDGLDLREEVEPIRALFATPTALFKAAPRWGVVERVVTVHPHRARVERGGGLVGFSCLPG